MSRTWPIPQLRALDSPPLDDEEEVEGEPEETARRLRSIAISLCALLGLIAILVAGDLARAGVRAQIDARLTADGAGANSGLVSIESTQLALLREITFTEGVSAALVARDPTVLNELVTPLQANSGVPMVDVVLPSGQVVFAVRSRGAPQPVASRKGLPAVATSIKEVDSSLGGRFSEIAMLQKAPVLLTIGPLQSGTHAVGVVIVMTPLADVLGQLSSETGVTLTAYNKSGEAIATTSLANPPVLARATAASLFDGKSVLVRETGSTREELGRLIVEHSAGAVLGVSMPDDSLRTEIVVDLVGGLGLLVVIFLLSLPVRRRREPEES